jgi:DNA sulfur modification protein DndC
VLETQQHVRREGPDPNAQLISDDELAEIRRLWRHEAQDWEDSVPKIYREVVGQDLDWVDDDASNLKAADAELLSEICRRHGVPDRLPHKLLDKVREKQGMGRRAGIYDEIDAVIREDWLNDEEIANLEPVDDDDSVE